MNSGDCGSSDSEKNEICCTPPDILETAKTATLNLLPEKSKKQYSKAYAEFMDWRNLNQAHSFSENVLLDYFTKLSEKYKSSSLWKIYSMLRSTLNVNNDINIERYSKLRALLNRNSEGYQPKKSKAFGPEEVNRFINEAPDEIYLATKVALIMSIEDIQDLGSALMITIPKTKTKIVRKFTVTGKYYKICKTYIDIRATNVGIPNFFMNYQKGKCTLQKIGINKFAAMGKQIATFLKLPNPEMYTGHCFRRPSATLLVDGGGDITALKRHGGWKSTSVAEGYLEDSMLNKKKTADSILQSIEQCSSSSKSTFTQKTSTNNMNKNVSVDINATPTLNFTNCENITINLVTKYDK